MRDRRAINLTRRFGSALHRRADFLGSADGHVEVGDEARRQRIDPAVHAELLAAGPGVLDEHGGGDIAYLPDHVELAKAIEPRALLRDRVELMAMLAADFAD